MKKIKLTSRDNVKVYDVLGRELRENDTVVFYDRTARQLNVGLIAPLSMSHDAGKIRLYNCQFSKCDIAYRSSHVFPEETSKITDKSWLKKNAETYEGYSDNTIYGHIKCRV